MKGKWLVSFFVTCSSGELRARTPPFCFSGLYVGCFDETENWNPFFLVVFFFWSVGCFGFGDGTRGRGCGRECDKAFFCDFFYLFFLVAPSHGGCLLFFCFRICFFFFLSFYLWGVYCSFFFFFWLRLRFLFYRMPNATSIAYLQSFFRRLLLLLLSFISHIVCLFRCLFFGCHSLFFLCKLPMINCGVLFFGNYRPVFFFFW
ncbi:hypothetical protein P167DRAFT_283219 [Morchella conica CCBAS932]|uniref:Uncharacterized protein n=1 Tax=Morchella conica CCBAS932 TaxID=1392247 RepID=A0A3N4KKT5_9PEZI|nr:hypothetical protein P167DRAFT_283219 [Morchella conica CCBAS932]